MHIDKYGYVKRRPERIQGKLARKQAENDVMHTKPRWLSHKL